MSKALKKYIPCVRRWVDERRCLLIGSVMLAAAIGIIGLASKGTGQERVGHRPAPHDARHEGEEKVIAENRAAYAQGVEVRNLAEEYRMQPGDLAPQRPS